MENSDSSSIASRLSPDVLKQLTELQQTLPDFTPLKQEILPKTPEQLFVEVQTFLDENSHSEEVIPHISQPEENIGLTERIASIVQEHYGDSLPVVHFTNGAIGNNLDELKSSGFIERFMEKGSVGKLHVGAFRNQSKPGQPFEDMSIQDNGVINVLHKARDIAREFSHHGLRTNKNQLKENRGSTFSLPMALLFPKPDRLARGTDNYDHWIMKDPQGAEKILSIVSFNPEYALGSIVEGHQEQNNILKELIHGLGLYRLNQIRQQFQHTQDAHLKEDLAIYGHDLVDAYLISRADYDTSFDTKKLNPSTQEIIGQRRKKYNLFNQ